MASIQQKLREEILDTLRSVKKTQCPNVYDYIQTHRGYMYVENSIINMVISDGLAPDECIAHIESELCEV